MESTSRKMKVQLKYKNEEIEDRNMDPYIELLNMKHPQEIPNILFNNSSDNLAVHEDRRYTIHNLSVYPSAFLLYALIINRGRTCNLFRELKVKKGTSAFWEKIFYSLLPK